MTNRISTIFDFKEQGGGLQKIRTDVAAADTATGKFKAGWQGAMTSVKAYGAEAALAVGTTLVAGAVKAGQEFANAAIEAGRFADATGVSTEQASKWISVADDLGLNADDVQKAFLRLNKEIGEGGGVAEEYGIKLQRTADGAADANATMLETIRVVNGIKDPTERARVAQELFGRSYANIAELIFDDAEKVAAALESTSEAQVFDREEVEKARRYRAAMDQLNDVLTDLTMTVGEEVVPVLSDFSDALLVVKEASDAIPEMPGWLKAVKQFSIVDVMNPVKQIKSLGSVFGITGDQAETSSEQVEVLVDRIGQLRDETAVAAAEQLTHADALKNSTRETTYQADATEELGRIQQAVTGYVDAARRAQERFMESIRHSRDELGNLKREIDDQQAWINFLDTADRINDKLADQETNTRDAMSAVLEYKEAVIEYAEVIDLPDTVTTRLLADIDEGKRAEVEAFLERLGNGVTLPITLAVRNNINDALRSRGVSARVDTDGNLRQRHSGGRTTPGETYQVLPGEVFVPDVPGAVRSRPDADRMMGESGAGMSFTTIIEGNVYGVDDLERRLDERDRRLAARIAQGRRG